MPVIALPALVIAGAVLVFILATAVLVGLAGRAVPNVPLIGGAIRGAMTRAAAAMSAWAENLFDDAMYAAGYVTLGIGLSVWWVASTAVNAIGHVLGVARMAAALAEQLFQAGLAHADGLYNDALSLMRSGDAAVLRDAESLYNESIGHAEQLYNDAVAYATGEAQAVLQDARVLYNDSIAYATGEAQAVLRDAQSLYNQSVANTAATAGFLLQDLEQEATRATAQVEGAIAEARSTAAQLAHTAVTNATSSLDAAAADVLNPTLDALFPALGIIAPALPAEIERALGLGSLTGEGSVTGLIGALGVLAPAIAGVATEVAECTVPMCRNLGGLSSLFGALTDGALLGVLLAFLVEAADNPAAAAADAEAALGGLTSDVAGTFRSLLGV